MKDERPNQAPTHELELGVICDDCSTHFHPDGETNFMGCHSGDTDCSPFTQIVHYCADCYDKRTQAWDRKVDAYEESGTL